MESTAWLACSQQTKGAHRRARRRACESARRGRHGGNCPGCQKDCAACAQRSLSVSNCRARRCAGSDLVAHFTLSRTAASRVPASSQGAVRRSQPYWHRRNAHEHSTGQQRAIPECIGAGTGAAADASVALSGSHCLLIGDWSSQGSLTPCVGAKTAIGSAFGAADPRMTDSPTAWPSTWKLASRRASIARCNVGYLRTLFWACACAAHAPSPLFVGARCALAAAPAVATCTLPRQTGVNPFLQRAAASIP